MSKRWARVLLYNEEWMITQWDGDRLEIAPRDGVAIMMDIGLLREILDTIDKYHQDNK